MTDAANPEPGFYAVLAETGRLVGCVRRTERGWWTGNGGGVPAWPYSGWTPGPRIEDLLRAAQGPHGVGWEDIALAPQDGLPVWVYAAMREGLPPFETPCAWRADAGWCVDELRPVTHWHPNTTKMLRDAERYRWLIDHHSWVYPEEKWGEPSPGEAGIGYEWRQSKPGEFPGFDDLIDAEIAREREGG